MELREFQPGESSAIQRIARESLTASYGGAFDEALVEDLVAQWYNEETVEQLVDDENALLVVAATDEAVGYAQGEIIGTDPVIGDVQWLHVRPDARGERVGVQLLGDLVDRMESRGASLVRGRALAVNEDGASFFAEHGFERADTETVEIGGETFEELVFETETDRDADEEVVGTVTGPDGRELYVDYTAGETGVEAPMYPTFTDDDLAEEYGWFCSNCDSAETAMDSAGRIKCQQCENTRTATRWDGSYL